MAVTDQGYTTGADRQLEETMRRKVAASGQATQNGSVKPVEVNDTKKTQVRAQFDALLDA